MDAIVKVISTLIEHNADINCSFLDGPNAGETPLISAARLNQLDLVKMLIEKKANVSAVAKNGRTAFYYAVDKKNEDLLNCLIEASKDSEADLNRRYERNMALTHVTLQKINNSFAAQDALKILELLFEKGLDPDSTDAAGDTPLHVAARSDTAKDIVTLLIHKGCNPQQTNNSERTVFSVADKKMIPIIIQVSNEPESIEAMEERAQIKREREEEEIENRIRYRDSQLITNTPSETGEKKIDSKKKAQLLAMTKRGGTLRTPKHNKGTKFTPIKKMEARAWGGSKQAAKFQRDTRLHIRDIKEKVLKQIDELREEVKKIRKKIDVEAGNVSESEHLSEEDNESNIDNENDQDSFHNELPPPGTELNNDHSNPSINADEKNETLDLQQHHTQNEEEDKLELQNQQHLSNEDDNMDLNIQDQHNSNNEDNLDLNAQDQHISNNEDNLDLETHEQQHSHNDDENMELSYPEEPNPQNDDINLDLSQPNSHNDDEIGLQIDDIAADGEQNSNQDNDQQIDEILNGSDLNIDIGE